MTSHLSAADRAELNRAWAELAAAQRIIERLLGDDDPTGLTYSRDDDEPAQPESLPPHEGHHLGGRVRPTNSPAGSAFDTVERRTHQFSGRPGSTLSAATLGSAAGMGAVARGVASTVPTLRGGGLR